MTPALHVHILNCPEEEALRLLESQLAEGIQCTFGKKLPAPPLYEALVAGRPSREFLEASPRLRAVVIPWAGLSTTTREALDEYPHLTVHNLHHNAAPTAETALALLFAAAKQVIPFDRTLREHDWRPRYLPSKTILISGKKALIVGYGSIGQRVGEALKALGVKVRAIRRNPATTFKKEIYPPQELQRLLPEADFLILTLPLTPETRGLIGAAELALLPQQAVLVNVSRGPIVDQKALYQALKSGALFGAGLDVWYNYPHAEAERENTPPADFPFHELDNMVMSPHRGGSTQATQHLRMMHLAKLLNAIARGERMYNRVNLERGY